MMKTLTWVDVTHMRELKKVSAVSWPKIVKTAKTLGIWGFILLSSRGWAHEVKYLDKHWLTLSAMYDSIQQANRQIDLHYYQIDPCSTSVKVLVDALGERKKKLPHLRIRVIADAWPFETATHANILAADLKSKGIKFQIFNPTQRNTLATFSLADPNRRTHVKYMVIDGETDNPVVITGSTNLHDTHFGMSVEGANRKKGVNFIERDVWIRGPAAKSAQAHFEWAWRQTYWGSPAVPRSSLKQMKKCLSRGVREAQLKGELAARAALTQKSNPTFVCQNTQFVADDKEFYKIAELDSNIDGKLGRLTSETEAERERLIFSKATVKMIYDLLVDKSVKNISFENYIYLPYGKIKEALEQKKKAQVPILAYTNYLQKSLEIFENLHNWTVSNDARGSQKILSIATIDHPAYRWSLTPSQVSYQNHSKIFVTNGQNLVVSSFNLDPRSYHLNLESAAAFYDCPELAKRAEQVSYELLIHHTPAQKQALFQRSRGNGFQIDYTYWSNLRDFFAGQHY